MCKEKKLRERERVWDERDKSRENGKREFVREIGKERVDEKENGNITLMRENERREIIDERDKVR